MFEVMVLFGDDFDVFVDVLMFMGVVKWCVDVYVDGDWYWSVYVWFVDV